MPVATHLMTVAEFMELPNPSNGNKQELRAGEVVEVPPPILEHNVVQENVKLFLWSAKPIGSYAAMEFPFRALPEHEVRVADVAWVSATRWKQTSRKGYLLGAPDLMIEVLSPSNTRSEMRERQSLCLANGTVEFWIVNIDQRNISVTHRDGSVQTYNPGDHIPLALLNAPPVPVDAIFADLS